MNALIFPGQGSQFVGMGKDLYESNDEAKNKFLLANKILDFDITDVMFNGTVEDLKKTEITQPAIFIHSCITYFISNVKNISAFAGHSLGEFSALTCSGSLSFEDGLELVLIRARAMQNACKNNDSTMAAILALSDEEVSNTCEKIDNVVPANYNCPGQIVISGSKEGIEKACEIFKEKGGKAIPLPVGGGFHSPYMESARIELEDAVNQANIITPSAPIYQNYDAKGHTNSDNLRNNLVSQLTSPVKWTQSVDNMINDNIKGFIECGPGRVLQGLVKKINRDSEVSSL
jgi:[acyl-carrier-protein] S-malonyltransferase